MLIVNRSQITEVVTKRSISHTVLLNGIRFRRIEEIKVTIPYMDTNVVVSKSTIKWSQYVGERTITDLSKKEVDKLSLETEYWKININERNGNAY